MKHLIASLALLGVCAWGASIFAAESKSSWQAQWEKTVDRAKKEGKLSLYIYDGEDILATVARLFQKKYPEIDIVTTPGRGNTLAPRIMAERRAGKLSLYI